MLRRRRASVTDLEAFRRGAASVGGCELSPEDDSVLRSGGQLKQYGPRPRISTAHPSSHSPASTAVGEHRAPLSAVESSVDGGAPPNLDDKRRQERQQVWARRDAQTIAEVCERLDIYEQDNAALQCDNMRLRSELNQALAQLRIARQQRDQFCAQLVHEDNEK